MKARPKVSLACILMTATLLAMPVFPSVGLGATLSWTGTNGNWETSANWTPASLPGANDSVVLTAPNNVTVTIASTSQTIASLSGQDNLVLAGGDLTIKSTIGTMSTLQGALTLNPNRNLTINGLWTTLNVTGAVSFDQANLYAQAGGQMTLNAASYNSGSGGHTIQADGLLSAIDLSSMNRPLYGAGNNAQSYWAATAGGTLKMTNVPVIAQNAQVRADGANSLVDISGAILWDGSNQSGGTDYAQIVASNGGTVKTTGMATLKAVGLSASGGSSLLFPALTAYIPDTDQSNNITATGPNSTIDMSHVTGTLTAPNTTSYVVYVTANNGGVVNMSSLTSAIQDVQFSASGSNGSNGKIDLSSLTTLDGTNMGGNVGLWASNGGQILVPQLATVKQATLSVSGGSSLNMPAMANYVAAAYQQGNSSISASGPGSSISMANMAGPLVGISSNPWGYYLGVTASNGGVINMSSLTSAVHNVQFVASSSNGNNGKIDLSALTTFDSTGQTSSCLEADNGGQILAPQLATVIEANLSVSGGSTLSLPALTSYVGAAYQQGNNSISASGPNSLIDMSSSAAGTLTGVSNNPWGYYVSVNASNGGRINMSGMTSILHNVQFVASGTTGNNGVINLTAATLFDASGQNASCLEADNGGQLFAPQLALIKGGVSISISGGSSISLPALTTIDASNSGTPTITASGGGQILVPSLASMTEMSVSVSGGSTIAFPALASYTGATYQQGNNAINASGRGSSIDMSNMTGMLLGVSSNPWGYYVGVNASNGATINLSRLTGVARNVQFVASGTNGNNGKIDLSALTTFDSSGQTSSCLEADNGGQIVVPQLATVIEANLSVSGGSTLSLPALTSYVGAAYQQGNNSISASGPNSLIDMSSSAVGTLTGVSNNPWGYYVSVNASNGGRINMNGMTSVLHNVQFVASGTTGSNGVINLPAATLFDASGQNASCLEADNGGQLLVPRMAIIKGGVSISVSGGSSISLPALTTIDASNSGTPTITVSGSGQILMPSLTSMTEMSVSVSGGSTIAFPALSTYTGATYQQGNNSINASGRGSSIDMSNMTGPMLGISNNPWGYYVGVNASNGGTVNLSKLTSVARNVQFVASGTNGNNGKIDLSALTTFDASGQASSCLEADNLGQIVVPQLVTVIEANLSVSGGSTLSLPALTTYQGAGYQQGNNSINASGSGSLIDMSSTSVGTLIGVSNNPWGYYVGVNASNGGRINMNGVTSAVHNVQFVASGSNGNNGVINLPALATFDASGQIASTIEADNGGQILVPQLASVLSANITVSGGSTINLPSLNRYVGAGYQQGNNTISASGPGSLINATSMAAGSLTGISPNPWGYYVNVSASNGGRINLGGIATVTQDVQFNASGVNGNYGVINLPSLTLFDATGWTGTQVSASSGGQVLLPQLATAKGVNIYVSASSSIALPALTSYVGVSGQSSYIQASAGTIDTTGSSFTLLGAPSGSGTVYVQALSGGLNNFSGATAISGQVQLYASGAGSVLDVTGAKTIAGVQSGTTLDINPTSGGTIKLGYPTLSGLTRLINNSGGTLTAGTVTIAPNASTTVFGSLTGSLVNSGNLTIDSSPTTYSLTGNFAQTATGTINIQVTGANTYTKLNIGGGFTAGGLFNLSLSGFTPTLNEQFQIFNASSYVGIFNNYTLPSLPSGLVWRTENLASSGSLYIGSTPFITTPDTLTWANAQNGTFGVASNWTDAAKLNRAPLSYDTAIFSAPGAYNVDFAVPASMNNLTVAAGSVTWNLNGNAVTVAQPATIQGRLAVNGGSLTDNLGVNLPLGGELDLAAGTGLAGTVQISGGTLSIANTLTLTNASSISLNTPSSQIVLAGGKLDCASLTTLNLYGATLSGHGLVYGNLNLGSTQNQGTIAGDGQPLSIYGNVSGSGAISHATIYGNVHVGNSPGIMHLDNVTLSAATAVAMELYGTDATLFDQLDVGPNVNFNGAAINVTFASGYTPNIHDSFALFTGSGLSSLSGANLSLPAGWVLNSSDVLVSTAAGTSSGFGIMNMANVGLGSSDAIALDIAGTDLAHLDQLVLGDNVQFNGATLTIEFASGFVPHQTDVFPLFSGTGLSSLQGANIIVPNGWMISGDDLVSAVPEPASLSLLALGAVGLLARRGRKSA